MTPIDHVIGIKTIMEDRFKLMRVQYNVILETSVMHQRLLKEA